MLYPAKKCVLSNLTEAQNLFWRYDTSNVVQIGPDAKFLLKFAGCDKQCLYFHPRGCCAGGEAWRLNSNAFGQCHTKRNGKRVFFSEIISKNLQIGNRFVAWDEVRKVEYIVFRQDGDFVAFSLQNVKSRSHGDLSDTATLRYYVIGNLSSWASLNACVD